MEYDWNFQAFGPFWFAFVRGAYVTLALSILSFCIGTTAGVPLGIMLYSSPGRWIFLLINDAIRAVPVLVMLLFIYFFPYQAVFGLTPPNPFWCSVIAIAIAQAAFTADVVRGAIGGVQRGSLMAARALGLKESTIWCHVIVPDVIRQILPALIAFFIGIVRLSSLASIIGCQELVFTTRIVVTQTYRSLEAWIVVAAIYVVLVTPLTVMGRLIEGSTWLKRR